MVNEGECHMVNLGIAGMGYIGRVHLEASQKVPEARVVAVATLQPNPILDSYPDLRICSSYQELLQDEQVDAVVICLPTDLHEQVTLEAAERGGETVARRASARPSG